MIGRMCTGLAFLPVFAPAAAQPVQCQRTLFGYPLLDHAAVSDAGGQGIMR